MDIRSIRLMSDEQILDAIEDKHEEIFNLRFQKASAQMEDTNVIRDAKNDLARLFTVKRERELASAQMVGGDGDDQ
jgi:large subunit ribosomal protein L29